MVDCDCDCQSEESQEDFDPAEDCAIGQESVSPFPNPNDVVM